MITFRPFFLALTFALFLPVAPGAVAKDETSRWPIINYENRFVPVVGRGGMVASPEKLAAEVGTDILRAGGPDRDVLPLRLRPRRRS